MSKTVFAIQLACNLSSGTPFLETYDIPKAQKVLYIATEMKDEDLKDRFIRTSHYVKSNPDNLVLICTKGTSFKFNTNFGRQAIRELIQKYYKRPPKVIIIDSVYRAFYGSLTKDDIVNDFLLEVDKMAGEFDAAVMMVHHTKKPLRDREMRELDIIDADTYGSQFLIGAVDHLIRLEKIYKENAPLDRFIRCDTQRTGNIITNVRIRLHEPDPLYFYIIDNTEVEKQNVYELLTKQDKPMTIAEIVKQTKHCKTIVYGALKRLQTEGKIDKTGTRTKMYEVKR